MGPGRVLGESGEGARNKSGRPANWNEEGRPGRREFTSAREQAKKGERPTNVYLSQPI